MSAEATIDVRRLLRAGREPYTTVRTRMDALKLGETLIVISPFLPAPLIELSRSVGHEVRTEHRADGAWTTRISRSD